MIRRMSLWYWIDSGQPWTGGVFAWGVFTIEKAAQRDWQHAVAYAAGVAICWGGAPAEAPARAAESVVECAAPSAGGEYLMKFVTRQIDADLWATLEMLTAQAMGDLALKLHPSVALHTTNDILRIIMTDIGAFDLVSGYGEHPRPGSELREWVRRQRGKRVGVRRAPVSEELR